MIEEQNSRKTWYEDDESGTPVLCALILFFSNFIAAFIYSFSKYDGFWDVFTSFFVCILWGGILLGPTMALLVMLYNIMSRLINDNLRNYGIEFKIGDYNYSISLFEILNGTILLIVPNFVIQKIFGISLFSILTAII